MSHACDGRDLSCLGCAAMARRHDTVRAAMTVDDRLDDIKRVRIWSRLAQQLDAPARRRARWPAIAFAVAAAAAAATVVIVVRTRETPHTLTVAADATLTSRLGPYTRAALVGSAELEIVGTPGASTSVRLRTGTLLAAFDGGPGRSLRIDAPGASIDVIGTVFAVDVRDAGTCVSVTRGKVRVTTPSDVIAVAGGERFCTDEGRTQPIAPAVKEALERHEPVITARVEGAPTPPKAGADVRSVDAVRPSDPAADRAVSADRTTPDLPVSPDRTTTGPVSATGAVSPDRTTTGPVSGSSAVSPDWTTTGPVSGLGTTRTTPAGRTTTPSDPDTRTGSSQATSAGRTTAPSDPDTRTGSSQATSAGRTTTPSDPDSRKGSDPRVSADRTATRSTPTPVPEPRTTLPTSPPAVASADDLYRAAEAALATRDHVAADRALGRLVTEYPSSALVDQAHYERARIAYHHRAWATARRHLDRLAAMPSTPLAEPGHYLACRIAVEARDGEAESCLVDYRKAHPRSPHDLDVLGLLVRLSHASGGCGRAATVIDELVRMHPRSDLAGAWRARCPGAR